MKSTTLSWLKTDIRHYKSIENFSHFGTIKVLTNLLTSFYLLVLLSIKYYPEKIGLIFTFYQLDFDHINAVDVQKMFLLGSLVGIVVAIIVGGSLMSSIFSHRQNVQRIPKWLKNDASVRTLLAVIQSSSITPVGFETLLSLGIGLFGILLYVFLFLVNDEQTDLPLMLSTTMYYSVFFYSCMQSMYTLFNKYAFLTAALIIAVITIPHYLLQYEILPFQYEEVVLFWLPLFGLYIFPKLFKKAV